MSDDRTPCPTAKQLSEYGLGKLSAPDLSAIHEHVASCPQCQKKLLAQPSDSFIGQLRAAAPQDSSTLLPRPMPLQPTTLADLPPELAASSKFEVLGKLGEGGMGAVYKARHTFLNELVAIKVMNAESLGHPDARSRFLREMQAVGQLKHKNIVRALDAEQIGELLVLVMEYVEGVTLDRLVAQKGMLPVAYSCQCIARAALGLQYAHEKQMVHRDVKPANLILAAKEKEIKLLDFGLARGPRERMTRGNQTQIGAVMGTPAFMAPEQTTDASSADIRADVYSLGCTLYFLLAGWSPFQRESVVSTMLAQVEEEARPLTEVRSDVPAGLWAVVAKMLAKKPEDRYQTPKEVEQALRPFVTGGAKAGQTVGGMVKADHALTATVVESNTSKMKPVLAPTRIQPPAVPAEKPSRTILSASGPVAGRSRSNHASGKMPWLTWKVWVAVVAACLMVACLLLGAVVLIILSPGEKAAVETDEKGEAIRGSVKQQPSKNLPPVAPNFPRPAGAETDNKGFEPLFNGKDLTGWVVDGGYENAWQVKNGDLIVHGSEKDDWRTQSYLLTERDFKDFRMRFQFQRTSDNVCSGIALRAVPHETTATSEPARKGSDRDFPYHLTVWIGKYPETEETGSLWWCLKPNKVFLRPDRQPKLKPIGEWNDMEVEMRGQSLRIAVNGSDIKNVMLNNIGQPEVPVVGLSRFSGRIGFLKRIGEVRYRKIEIKDLTEEAAK